MKSKEIFLVLDNIRSRENVGSIFRTADGAGVSKIYLCGITPRPNTMGTMSKYMVPMTDPRVDKILKTALGAETWVPWEYHKQTWRCLLKLKNENEKLKIIGLERFDKLTASKLKIRQQSLFKFKPQFPLALVMGNEVKGISPKILKYCDKVVAIPMFGRKESLNVAVATGIAIYNIKKFHTGGDSRRSSST